MTYQVSMRSLTCITKYRKMIKVCIFCFSRG